MNIQFAIKGDDIYILEVNPRASRTAPFVSKATGVPLPYLATQVMLGKTLEELDPWSLRKGGFVCVKEAVLPFQRFPGVDVILGPEMHSTGEVMGMGPSFGEAFLKSQLGAGQALPQGGRIFLSVNDRDKPYLPEVAQKFAELGFQLLATRGTAAVLRQRGLDVEEVLKVYEGRPNIVDLLINHEVALVINTASGKHTAKDSKAIRHAALMFKVPLLHHHRRRQGHGHGHRLPPRRGACGKSAGILRAGSCGGSYESIAGAGRRFYVGRQVLYRRVRNRRRSHLHHGHDRLSGGPHRPLLLRADGLHDLPACGQLRHLP